MKYVVNHDYIVPIGVLTPLLPSHFLGAFLEAAHWIKKREKVNRKKNVSTF
jgi:hypothetical protein